MDKFWKGYYINPCPRDTPWQKQSQVLEIGCKFDSELNHKRQRRDKFSYKSHNSQRLKKNKACLLTLQHEKFLPRNSIETLCGIDNHLVWLHIKISQQLRKHKSSCQMSKKCDRSCRSPEAWCDESFINFLSDSKHSKNSPERTVKGMTTSSLNKCVLHLTCLTHLTSLKLRSSSCSEARCLLHMGIVSWAEVSSSGAPRKEQEGAVGIAIMRVGWRGT